MVLDQALSSLTNFALSLIVLRAVGVREFGAFTICLGSYFIALGISQALCSEPQVVRFSLVSEPEWRHSTEDATGLSLLVGVTGSLALLLCSWVTDGAVGAALTTLAVVLPGLLLQDAWRYSFFAAGLPAKAFWNDLVWAGSQALFLGWVFATGTPTVASCVAAWGAAATVAALFGAAQSHCVPRLGRFHHWLYEHRELAPRFSIEFIIDRGASQLMLFAVGAISGLAALGTLNAARVVFGPFNVIALGAVGFGVPEGVRIRRQHPERLLAMVRMLTVGLAALAALWAVLALVLPVHLGAELLGRNWPQVRALLPFAGVWVAAAGATQGARVGLRVLGDAARSLRARTISAALVALGGTLGAVWAQAEGAVIGLAVANCAAASLWWHHFHRSNQVFLALPAAEPPSSADTMPEQPPRLEAGTSAL